MATLMGKIWQLRHDHLVNLIEVFRRKKRLYLVFEFVDHTVLDELEKCPNGLDENTCRKILWQVLRGTEFCHLHHIIHRDIKPENILVSKAGIVKICDFGFARTLAQPGETYTDYVATRWYRAPELLVGDTKYGKAVDIWAVGCLLSEMLTGEPLFPGDSDIDQLYHIVKCFGNLTPRHREVFLRNPLFVGMRIPEVREIQPLERKFTKVSTEALDFMKQCLRLDPDNRPTCTDLLKHGLFSRDGFGSRYPVELKHKIHKENANNPLYKTPSANLDSAESDNREGESSKGGAAGAASKKKKKSESKDSSSHPLAKDYKKESTFYNSPKKESITGEKKKSVLGSTTSTTAPTTSSTPVNNEAERRSPSKKTSPPIANGNTVSLPPAFASTADSSEKEKDERRGHQHTPSQSPQAMTSIPPINQSGQTTTPSSMQGSSPSILNNHASAHLVHSSFPHNIPSPSSNAPFSTFQYRVSPDKVLPKKKDQSFGKKTSVTTGSPSLNISPQPMLTSEKTYIHDKSMQSKFKATDRSMQGGVSLPEVKGASEVLNRPKEKSLPLKKSTVSSIPHIANIDPFGTSNSQADNYSDEDGLPTVV